MKTLAEFKKRLKVGDKLHTVVHKSFCGYEDNKPIFKEKDLGIREVSKAQLNGFTLKTKDANGEFYDSWFFYPSAKEVEIIDENTIHILADEISSAMTYKFVAINN